MTRSDLLDRGAEQYRTGALQAAAATFGQILQDVPDDAEALSNLAGVLNAAQCAPAAEAACRAALTAKPGYWAALANLGGALHRQNRLDEAASAYIAAVNANPANVSAWTNLGIVFTEQWRMDGALTAHRAALKLAPHDPEVRNNRAIALLTAGAYHEGFAEFEHRWNCPKMAPHGMTVPQWRGEPTGDRVVLVHDEGGFGDTLQFVRFVPALTQRGVRIVLRVQAPLLRLISRNLPEAGQIVCAEDALPPHDLHCPLLSLPAILGIGLQDLPGPAPYLTAEAQAVACWRERLFATSDGRLLRVGLVWAGSPLLGMPEARAMNLRRSVSLAQLAPLAGVAGIGFVSLQLGGTEEAAQVHGLRLFDAMTEMRDFEDTAALVAALDLVVTVDSAVAHLAAALGRPTWVMSRHDACWRWLAGRRDSPWYPTLRLYRQPVPGDWDSLVAEVARDLDGLVQRSKQGLLF